MSIEELKELQRKLIKTHKKYSRIEKTLALIMVLSTIIKRKEVYYE